MKKVFSSFQEMMATVRGKVEEITPEEYHEPEVAKVGEAAVGEEKPKRKRKKKED